MPKTTKLNKDNLVEQLVEFGFIAEQIPTCFSSVDLATVLNDVLPIVKLSVGAKNTTAPTTLSTFKNDISRRVLSLPNPEAFIRVAKLMAENWEDLRNAAQSPNSLSPITYIRSYPEEEIEMLNSENVRDYFHSRSDFVEGVKNCIKVALGYKYRLDVDVSNFYNSIYTHSIAWAMCGKDNAKQYFRTQEPITIKKTYELAEKFDKFSRYQKNNETNGILVGPYPSRIYSEIIMAELDRKLVERRYIFKRYVDDYKFYFRTEAQAQESLPIIEKVLNEYNLNLNASKTAIHRFPFEIISQMKQDFVDALKREGVFGVLNTAACFYVNGEKGAFKYALKMLKGHEIPMDDFDIIMPTLINIMLLDPKYGKYVIGYLKSNIDKFDHDILSGIINQEMKSSLNNELQQESLLFMQIIRELDLNLDAANLITTLHAGDDFSIIVALDIWKNRNASVKRNRNEAEQIGKEIQLLASLLEGEKYTGARWLLLYEIQRHQLIKKELFQPPEENEFFKKLFERNVTFYQSIKKP